MPNVERDLPAQVRARRKAKGLSQASLAERADVSTELVSRVERGRCLPSLRTLLAFSDALGCTPNDLLGIRSADTPKDIGALLDLLRSLPAARRRELKRIAEALAVYQRQG